MAAAIARVLGGAVSAEKKTNLGFDRGVTFMGALLQPKGFINWRMQMEVGMRYAFLGGGDDGRVVPGSDDHALGAGHAGGDPLDEAELPDVLQRSTTVVAHGR